MIKRTIGCVCVYFVTSSLALAGVSGIYDANNVLLGEFAESVSVIHSVRGYRFSVDGGSGSVTSSSNAVDIAGVTYDFTALLFSSNNCTGQAYVATGGSGQAGGMVFGAGSRGVYYVAKTPTASISAMGSSFNGNACGANSPANYDVVPAIPNDPVTTGVPNTPFTSPLRLEMVPLSQFFELFRNGFESSSSGNGQRNWWRTTS